MHREGGIRITLGAVDGAAGELSQRGVEERAARRRRVRRGRVEERAAFLSKSRGEEHGNLRLR